MLWKLLWVLSKPRRNKVFPEAWEGQRWLECQWRERTGSPFSSAGHWLFSLPKPGKVSEVLCREPPAWWDPWRAHTVVSWPEVCSGWLKTPSTVSISSLLAVTSYGMKRQQDAFGSKFVISGLWRGVQFLSQERQTQKITFYQSKVWENETSMTFWRGESIAPGFTARQWWLVPSRKLCGPCMGQAQLPGIMTVLWQSRSSVPICPIVKNIVRNTCWDSLRLTWGNKLRVKGLFFSESSVSWKTRSLSSVHMVAKKYFSHTAGSQIVHKKIQ